MDAPELLGHIAWASTLGDGGPARYLQRGQPLPEKYMPGRWFARLSAEARAAIVKHLESGPYPADWWVRCVV